MNTIKCKLHNLAVLRLSPRVVGRVAYVWVLCGPSCLLVSHDLATLRYFSLLSPKKVPRSVCACSKTPFSLKQSGPEEFGGLGVTVQWRCPA